MNLDLFKDGQKTQRFLGDVPIESLAKSPQNPRQTYDEKRVGELVDHIKSSGYDVTRAVKVHRGADGSLLVFAGSTRLEASRRVGLKAIPAFEFVGYSDDEVWRMAYEDNTSDGKHTTLPITDVWADYAARARTGKTTRQIAEALDVSQTIVSFRVRFHALSAKVKKAITAGVVAESALREIAALITAVIEPLAPWLTGEALFEYVVDQCVAKGADEKERKQLVERAKKMAALACEHHGSLPAEPVEAHKVTSFEKEAPAYKWDLRADFVKRLAAAKARTQTDVQAVIDALNSDIAKEKLAYAGWLKAQASKEALAAAEAAEAERLAEGRARLRPVVHFKSCLDGMAEVEDGSVDLVIADPPYGSMTSERETVRSGKAIKNNLAPWDEELCDPEKLDAFNEKWIGLAAQKLKPNGSIYVCGTKHNLTSVLVRLAGAGLEVLNLITWYKPNSTPTFLTDRYAYAAEYVVFARKGASHFFDAKQAKNYTSAIAPTKQSEDAQLRDVWVIPVCGGSERIQSGGKAAHPTQKPESLYEILVNVSCPPDGLILDPFAGTGTAAAVAHRLARRSVSYEVDPSMKDVIAARLESA